MKNKKYKYINFVFFFYTLFYYWSLYTRRLWSKCRGHTQIYSGFYWLNFIFEYLNINFLKASLNEILQNISTDIYLPNPEYFTYGPIFDVPTAFLDLLFGSDKTTYLLNFVIFLFFLYII